MSGGSFNYLCHADPEELPQRVADLLDMAAALTDRGYDDAAAETEDIICIIRHAHRQIDARRRRLQAVWQAVEWNASGDWGRERVDDTIAEYRTGMKPQR